MSNRPPCSEETKRKIRNSLLKRKKRLGYINSSETRKKLSIAMLGKKNGKRIKGKSYKSYAGKNCYWYGKHHSEKSKNKMRKKREERKKRLGYINSPETRRKISQACAGKKSRSWKGGISFEPYSIDWKDSLKRSIRERDKYICQICNAYGYPVHHIDYNKKNCDPNNLITVCIQCHAKTNYNRQYWIEYFGRRI